MNGKRLGTCLLAVSMNGAALRVIEVPAGSDAALESAVGFEIERHLPCARDEAAYRTIALSAALRSHNESLINAASAG